MGLASASSAHELSSKDVIAVQDGPLDELSKLQKLV